MNRDIANILKQKLSTLYDPLNGVITSLAGLTRVREVAISKQVNGTNVIRKIPQPIDCNEEQIPQDCPDCEPIFDLVPDNPTANEPKRCIVYFEGGKVNQLTIYPGGGKYSTILTLICWYDSRQFTPTDNLTSKLISLFIKTIGINSILLTQNEVLKNVQIMGHTPLDSDPNIFSKYTYSDFRQPYLGCPFGYFKIDFLIHFTTNESCLSDLVPIALPNCPPN